MGVGCRLGGSAGRCRVAIRVTDLASDLTRLFRAQIISDLLSRYFSAVDDKRLYHGTAAATFMPNGRLECPNGSALVGPDAIAVGQSESLPASGRPTMSPPTTWLISTGTLPGPGPGGAHRRRVAPERTYPAQYVAHGRGPVWDGHAKDWESRRLIGATDRESGYGPCGVAPARPSRPYIVEVVADHAFSSIGVTTAPNSARVA